MNGDDDIPPAHYSAFTAEDLEAMNNGNSGKKKKKKKKIKKKMSQDPIVASGLGPVEEDIPPSADEEEQSKKKKKKKTKNRKSQDPVIEEIHVVVETKEDNHSSEEHVQKKKKKGKKIKKKKSRDAISEISHVEESKEAHSSDESEDEHVQKKKKKGKKFRRKKSRDAISVSAHDHEDSPSSDESEDEHIQKKKKKKGKKFRRKKSRDAISVSAHDQEDSPSSDESEDEHVQKKKKKGKKFRRKKSRDAISVSAHDQEDSPSSDESEDEHIQKKKKKKGKKFRRKKSRDAISVSAHDQEDSPSSDESEDEHIQKKKKKKGKKFRRKKSRDAISVSAHDEESKEVHSSDDQHVQKRKPKKFKKKKSHDAVVGAMYEHDEVKIDIPPKKKGKKFKNKKSRASSLTEAEILRESDHSARDAKSKKGKKAKKGKKSKTQPPSNPRGLRKSVLMLETPKPDKYCAWLYYLVLTFILALFTSLSFFRLIGLVPTHPNTAEVTAAVNDYNSYVDAISDEVGENMSIIYQESLESQSAECIVLQNDATNAQDRVKANSTTYAEGYCDRFIVRLWDRAEELNLINESETYEACPSDIGLNIDLHWLLKSDNCTISSQCLYGFYRQEIPTGCSNSYDFDGFRDLEANQVNDRTCRNTLEEMISFANEYTEADAVDSDAFMESLEARLEYDYNYLLGFFSTISLDSSLTVDASISLDSLSLQSLPEFQSQLDYQLQYMDAAFDLYSDIYVYKDLLGLNLPNIDPPDYSVPTVSSITVDDVDIAINSIAYDISLFEEYSPPAIVGYSYNETFDYTIDYEFVPSNVTLSDSSLVDDVTEAIDYVSTFVDNFASFDLAFRLCIWLREVAVVLSANRRDFSTMKSRIKRMIGWVFANSVSWLLFGTLVWLGGNIVRMIDFDFSDITTELYTSCINEVVVSSSQDLVDYQEEIFTARTECDASIATLNNISAKINVELVDGLYSLRDNYEVYYQSINEGRTTFDIDTVAITATLDLVEFSLEPETYEIAKAEMAGFQSLTDIELYVVDTSLCDTPEAEEVTLQLDAKSLEIKNYITVIFVMTLLLNLVSRFFSLGLRDIFYMALTKGYSFDEPFTGSELRSRVSTRKIRGIVFFALTAGCLLAALIYAKLST